MDRFDCKNTNTFSLKFQTELESKAWLAGVAMMSLVVPMNRESFILAKMNVLMVSRCAHGCKW